MEFKCGSEARRSIVRNHVTINGIDYLEVKTLQNPDKTYPNPLLLIHCFKDVKGLDNENISIQGGVRVKNIGTEWAHVATKTFSTDHPNLVSAPEGELISNIDSPEKTLVVRSGHRGDFSNYDLLIVQSKDNTENPASGFDLLLSRIKFSFSVECPGEVDCACHDIHQDVFPEPAIDYMAKDYTSFRKLMLDRLSLIIPDWNERNPADFGMAMVDLLAYVGDHLSYYQDAVASEVYLGTARSRISAVRHARLLDYPVNNGRNARAWVRFAVKNDNLKIPKGTRLLTKTEYSAGTLSQVADIQEEVDLGAGVFETMYDATFFKSKNVITFYAWTETDCWLLAGSTSATIKNELARVNVFVWENVPEGTNMPSAETAKIVKFLAENFDIGWLEAANVIKSGDTIEISDGKSTIRMALGENNVILSISGQVVYEFDVSTDSGKHVVSASCLGVGDVLIFKDGSTAGADKDGDKDEPHPGRCHAVCITLVTSKTDTLTGQKVLELKWGVEDALPFPLCITKDGLPKSVIYGNVVLADHGCTTTAAIENIVVGGKYYPKIYGRPLTQCGPDFEVRVGGSNRSASSAFILESQRVKPAIRIEDNNGQIWSPARDLLSSDEFSKEFVAEIETDGVAYLRFNDKNMRNWAAMIDKGEFGNFRATFRIGNGTHGNVGPGSISRIFVGEGMAFSGIDYLSNPMPAKGGLDPETIESIRQFAPQAFRKQERAVTAADYEQVLNRHPQVHRAAVEKRWTGSWYTMFVAVDRKGGLEVDDDFEKEVVGFFEKYRLAGYDVEIQSPIYVPLEIGLEICVGKGHFVGEVKQELLLVFGGGSPQENGHKGFFHADNFTFGQPLYLSKIYNAAMAIDGVSSVIVTKFKRRGRAPTDEIERGVIKTGIREIIRLDNNPNFAENGVINFTFCGGENK